MAARAVPFAVCGLMFGSALLCGRFDLVRALRRRRRARQWLARWLAALVATLHLAFMVLLLIVIINTSNDEPYLLFFGLPPEASPLFVMPWVAGGLSLGLVLLAWPVWRERYWGLAGDAETGWCPRVPLLMTIRDKLALALREEP